MQLFVFYGDMQGNTDNRQNMALYIRIEKKKEFFLLSCKPKCRNPCGRTKMSLLRNYLLTNQTNTNKNNNNDTEVEKIKHDSSGKLFG